MKYTKKILSNGMHIILVPMKNTKLITMGFFVKAGSRNETNENSGIAHFLEHMMFQGTKNRSGIEIFKQLDTLGAIYNAATTTQYTYYYVYGSSNDTKQLLDIMLDIYVNPVFRTKEIKREKKVIIEEMRVRSDAPMTKLYSIMHRKIFAKTSLSRDIIGTADTVNSFVKKDFVDFRSKFYAPSNTIFVMAGNLTTGPILRMLKQVLEPIQNPTEKIPDYLAEKQVIFDNMQSQKSPYIYIKTNALYQQVYVIMAFPMYDMYNYKYGEIEMLSHLLSFGSSSRLNDALREKNGITYSSSAYPIAYSDSGLFLIQMVVNPVEFVRGVKIILQVLRKLKHELMTEDEMKKIMNVAKNETMYTLVKPIELLTYLGINFLVNRDYKPDIEATLRSYKKITREQIRKIAQNIFVRDKLNLYVYGNVSETNYDFIDL